jgi:hypothetical protein
MFSETDNLNVKRLVVAVLKDEGRLAHKRSLAIKFCKTTYSTFKTEERRKVN